MRGPTQRLYQVATSPETIALTQTHLSGEDPAIVGPGRWELYAHDFDLAHADGHTVFRMSLEWSRIFPTSTIGVDGFDALHALASSDALAHYHAVFAALRSRGIKPYVTLNHYTFPSWIHDGVGCTVDFAHCTARGWADPATIVPEMRGRDPDRQRAVVAELKLVRLEINRRAARDGSARRRRKMVVPRPWHPRTSRMKA